MAEWFKAAVLKTASPKGDVGSNPTPSARKFAKQILLLTLYFKHLAGRLLSKIFEVESVF
jgi:hypothetical protein